MIRCEYAPRGRCPLWPRVEKVVNRHVLRNRLTGMVIFTLLLVLIGLYS